MGSTNESLKDPSRAKRGQGYYLYIVKEIEGKIFGTSIIEGIRTRAEHRLFRK